MLAACEWASSFGTSPTQLKLQDASDEGGVKGNVEPNAWQDYYVVAEDEESNIYFEVEAVTEYSNAIGIYLSERLLPISNRLNPGAFLDYDEASMITAKGIRTFTVVIGQCYIIQGTIYYLSIRGGAPAGAGAYHPNVHYTVRAIRVPARLPSNASITGKLCDSRYLHYFWEVGAPLEGGMRTTVQKKDGELDAFYMRYEKCAGPAGTNIAKVGLDGHGTPRGSVLLPSSQQPLDLGRFYVSVKGKMEQCGNYEIWTDQVSPAEMELSAASSVRVGWFGVLLTALIMCIMWQHHAPH